jgi:PAS domain S-box-containing protein
MKDTGIEKKIHNALDKMLEGVQIIDFNWKYIYVNESVARQGNYSREELLGYTMMERYPEIEHSKLYKTIKKCMDKRIVTSMENEFTYNDGSGGWLELSIQPVPEGVFILSADITKRKNAEFAIHKLNEELEKRVIERTAQLESVNKELESFSYSISHDLRAPLRAVNGYAKMIEEDYGNILDDEGKRLLSIVQYNANRMGTLIDDLLTFSRVGKKEVQKSNINVREMMEATMNDIKKTLDHQAEIKTENIEDVHADYSLLNQVFFNLISNAVKYSSKKEKPVVLINSEIKNNEVVYHINDNGAGFDMKYSHKLFGVFQRLHRNEEFEGTGVGLAIVQRIINKHGGKVWAEAKVNEGASFYFTLPLK